MLYNVLKTLIELGRTEDISEKLDVFFAVGKLKEEEYIELAGLLPIAEAGAKTEE